MVLSLRVKNPQAEISRSTTGQWGEAAGHVRVCTALHISYQSKLQGPLAFQICLHMGCVWGALKITAWSPPFRSVM